MCTSSALFSVLFLLCMYSIVSQDNNTESGLLDGDSRSQSRKTYFIQLKKLLTPQEGDEKPTYVRINHYQNMRQPGDSQDDQIIEDNLAPENLEEGVGVKPCNFERAEEGGDERNLQAMGSPQHIDDEWIISPDRTIYDLPNITQEIYEAMLESNQSTAVNAYYMVKFFFERNTNHSSNIIKFDIEALANTTGEVVDAELHVYRLPRDSNLTRPNATENVVRLYQMTENIIEDGETSAEINSTMTHVPDVHKLANVIYISSNYEGWQVFKVKTVVDNWRSGEDNLGFLISTVDAHDREDHVEFAHRQRNGGKYQPTLVVYINEQRASKRASTQQRIPKPFKSMRRRVDFTANPCRRHVWYVSFHELGWNNFIIAPSGFMAYKCDGSCTSPSATSFTNHGKLISGGNPLQAVCCVPNSYKSLLIMFYDKESNVIIKEYDDMVVSGCGCR